MLPFPLCPCPHLDFPCVFQQAAQDSALIKMCRGQKLHTHTPQGNLEKKNYHESLLLSLALWAGGFLVPGSRLRGFSSWPGLAVLRQRLLFSASTGLCVERHSRRGGVRTTVLQTSETKSSTWWTPRKGAP